MMSIMSRCLQRTTIPSMVGVKKLLPKSWEYFPMFSFSWIHDYRTTLHLMSVMGMFTEEVHFQYDGSTDTQVLHIPFIIMIKSSFYFLIRLTGSLLYAGQ